MKAIYIDNQVIGREIAGQPANWTLLRDLLASNPGWRLVLSECNLLEIAFGSPERAAGATSLPLWRAPLIVPLRTDDRLPASPWPEPSQSQVPLVLSWRQPVAHRRKPQCHRDDAPIRLSE